MPLSNEDNPRRFGLGKRYREGVRSHSAVPWMREQLSRPKRREISRNDPFEKSYDFGIKRMITKTHTSSFSYPTEAAHRIKPIGHEKKESLLMWFT